MNKGTFEEHVPGNYTVKLFQLIKDNNTGEEWKPDQYGNRWYNVLFEGDAETFMWLKKDPPEEGKEYYGHIEKTASGKRLRFKTDKLPEQTISSNNLTNPDFHSVSVKENKYQRDVTSIPLDVWRTLVGIQGVPTNQTEFHRLHTTVQEHANELLRMIDNVRSGTHLDSPTQTPESFKAHPAAAAFSLWDQYRNRNVEPELTDEDMPEDL